MRDVRWERLFPDEIQAAFDELPGVYLPYGLCEPHGPQSMLGNDGLRAHALCVLAAQRQGGIVAPAGYWHIHELGRYALWGERVVGPSATSWLTALPPWMFFRNLLYHLRAVAAHGFRGAMVVSAHGGPHIGDLARFVDLVQPYLSVKVDACLDVAYNEPGFPGDGAKGDHAGKVETSLLWSLDPAAVDLSRVPPDADPAANGPWFAMAANVRDSDRRVGDAMNDAMADALARRLHELVDTCQATTPTRLTFTQTEQLWRDMVEPHLGEFDCMQDTWEPGQTIPEGSQWFANWPTPWPVP